MNPFPSFFIIQNATAIAAKKQKEAEVCPSCNKPEDIVCKCSHCGHEYNLDEETQESGEGFLAVVLITILIAVLLILFSSWTSKLDEKGFDRTFVQYLGDRLTYFWENIVLKLI